MTPDDESALGEWLADSAAAAELSVPLEVSVGCGRSWDDAAH